MFFDDEDARFQPRRIAQKVRAGELKRIRYAPKYREYVSDPFTLPPGSDVVLDCEVYQNYFLAAFKHVDTGKYFFAEMKAGQEFPVDLVRRAMFHFKTIGFNSLGYDLPIIQLALYGANTMAIKELSDDIIIEGNRHNLYNNPFNHVDLIEVAPLDGSLKLYAARVHCERMQEIPIDPSAWLTDEEIDDTREYCFNDLDNTELIYVEPNYGLKPHIELRERLGAEIGEDIRSKSDAQVGEAYINAKLKEITGKFPRKPQFDPDFEFYYKPPEWVSFETPQLQEALRVVMSEPFKLDAAGGPMMPEALSKLTFKLGKCSYKMGMGGLHSQEKTTAHIADDETDLIDRDVVSFYPWLIINSGFFPRHLGEIFIEIFRDDLVLRRMELKKLKDKLEAGLKIAINGIFGKLGSIYSTIFSPDLLIQVTITGQLALLKLIEMIELALIPVVSGNTDGAVIKCPKVRKRDLLRIIKQWEDLTGLKTEETRYKATYARDVNNYIAVKLKEAKDASGKTLLDDDGEIIWLDEIDGAKPKGAYTERGSAQNSALSKNPEHLICSDAVKDLLTKGTDVEDTIRGCRDMRRFVSVRQVRGGAHKDGWFLGKVVRWYYATGVTGTINYVSSGNTVPKSEGAKPYLEMPKGMFEADIDYDWYIRKSYEMLSDLGYYGNKPVQTTLF